VTGTASPVSGDENGEGQTQSIAGGASLTGTLAVPGDKSVSHRALLLAALAEGTSTVTGLSAGDDVARTRTAITALGAGVTEEGDTVTVHGGRSRLRPPADPLDLGNSGTGMRLLTGVVATLPGSTTLTGDDSLKNRPMDRVAEPLVQMGAAITGHGDRYLPPVTVTGGDLHGIDYTPPMASAQVKSAILLAGIAADGETVVREPVATRAYTEDLLAAAGAEIDVEWDGGAKVIRVRRSTLRCGAYTVPGDPSQAAFWLVGATIVPGSLVTVTGLTLGVERLGFIGVLRRMGATIEIEGQDAGFGSVTGYTCALHGTVVDASEIPSLDEVPILAVAAASALGRTRFEDVGELRVKESDRLAGTVELVRTFGAEATVEGDTLVIEGTGEPLRPGRFDAGGDHRMAMAAAIAGAACPVPGGPTVVTGWESVATSYPGFVDDLARLTAPATGFP
jgi:3-phosphoshikimate 1-carboxyvinyltransferase